MTRNERHGWALLYALIGVALIAFVLALGGCVSSTLSKAGQNPGYVRCTGKGSISFQGSGMAGAGIGAGEVNGGSIVADCGSGFEFEQGIPPAPGEAKP